MITLSRKFRSAYQIDTAKDERRNEKKTYKTNNIILMESDVCLLLSAF